ncbi:nuclear transport factor 2 family protein [Caulobacter sp. CCUG 60055]|uniref:nuclear transport factor 2 family protein n=1 Tax=Caulobacter sp. CCUG 60055 TaxID=2100090 RepID=UPI001FA6DAA1|nr:nuclear transport factor 2 family protein [Caulobacter sp. CCUG 60055]
MTYRSFATAGVLLAAVAVAPTWAATASGLAPDARRCANVAPVQTAERLKAAPGEIEAVMQAYFAAVANPAGLNDLFQPSAGAGLMNASGQVLKAGAVRDPWAPDAAARFRPRRSHALSQLVVAADGRTARGTWKALREKPTNPGVVEELAYVADFEVKDFLAQEWRIWRIRTYAPAEAPAPTPVHCHRSQLPPLW